MKLLDEFKEFINRGNAMDMAVGVIIGGAFIAIVTSLTSDLINPFIQLVTSPMGGGEEALSALVIPVAGTDGINFSSFISACINFLIIAFCVFLLVKAMNKLLHKEEAVKEAARKCPYCKSVVEKDATRCPHCTSDIEGK